MDYICKLIFLVVFFRLSSEQLWRCNRTELSPLGHPKSKKFEKIPTGPPGCFNKLLNSALSRWFSLYRAALFGVHSNLFESLVFCPGHRGRIAFEDKLKLIAMSESFASKCMFKLWGILFAEFASQLLLHTGFYSSQCLEGRLSCQYAEELPSEKQQVGLVTNNELLKGGVFPKALILSLTPLWIQWKFDPCCWCKPFNIMAKLTNISNHAFHLCRMIIGYHLWTHAYSVVNKKGIFRFISIHILKEREV